jgi:glycerol uptake facilitator-like aquaporin
MSSVAHRVVLETLGTAFLLATVIGSGIMAQRLSGGNDALALLCNTLPTGAILTVLILILGPVSGAHFNPAVSLAFWFDGGISWPMVGIYLLAQLCGAVVGVWAAHLMFELPVWQYSTHIRTGTGQWLAEAVATFGLLLTIFGCISGAPSAVAYAVGLYITAAYWFTGLDVIRKSRRHVGPITLGYVRRYRARRSGCVHSGAIGRHAGSRGDWPLAVERLNGRFGS